MVTQCQEGVRDEGSEALRAGSQWPACHHVKASTTHSPQEDSPSPSAVGLAAPIVNVWAHHWGEGLDPPSDYPRLLVGTC